MKNLKNVKNFDEIRTKFEKFEKIEIKNDLKEKMNKKMAEIPIFEGNAKSFENRFLK